MTVSGWAPSKRGDHQGKFDSLDHPTSGPSEPDARAQAEFELAGEKAWSWWSHKNLASIRTHCRGG